MINTFCLKRGLLIGAWLGNRPLGSMEIIMKRSEAIVLACDWKCQLSFHLSLREMGNRNMAPGLFLFMAPGHWFCPLVEWIHFDCFITFWRSALTGVNSRVVFIPSSHFKSVGLLQENVFFSVIVDIITSTMFVCLGDY